MTLLEKILEWANEVYGDDLIAQYVKNSNVNHGDGLAKFIACEIQDVWDDEATPADNRDNVVDALDRAKKQIEAVLWRLDDEGGEVWDTPITSDR